MFGKAVLHIAAVLFVIFMLHSPAPADVQPGPEPSSMESLFKKYWDLYEKQQESLAAGEQEAAPGECPGQIFGQWSQRPEKLFRAKWPYRAESYEILCSARPDLARRIYGLALFTKDLDPSVTLERFEKGAQGFHYSIGQLVEWAEAVEQGGQKFYTEEEKAFFRRLASEGVLVKKGGAWSAGPKIRHVLGAAPGRKRSLALNLNHERTHVFWDESPDFRETSIRKWRELSEAEREQVFKSLKGYNPDNEMQIIEEWAVRSHERELY